MIIHSLRSSLCDKVTYSHQSKKKKGICQLFIDPNLPWYIH